MYRVADCSLRSSSIGSAGRCRAAFNARSRSHSARVFAIPLGGDLDLPELLGRDPRGDGFGAEARLLLSVCGGVSGRRSAGSGNAQVVDCPAENLDRTLGSRQVASIAVLG